MNKSKSALCLVTLLATCSALVSCNKPTQANDGTIFTYTTATGTTVSYTASELLGSYQQAGNSASTEFDKVYEVLIRKLYQTPEYATSLKTCEINAKKNVESQQQAASNSAETNGTSYKEELEKIFDSFSVDNIEELYDHYLYEEEKEQYETKYKNDNLAAVRDGSTEGLASKNYLMAASENYGIANKGWIKETMPMNYRHILVKVSASSGEYTQATISEDKGSTAGEATKLATIIMRIAGANTTDGLTNASGARETFGSIAGSSDDTGSAAMYGAFDDPTTTSTNFVPEFKLGSYAFQTLYSKAYENIADEEEKNYYNENKVTLMPGLKEGATQESDVDTNQVLDDSGTTIYDFFKNGEKNDDGTYGGIGQIPYGAAVALLKAAKVTTDNNGNNVYEGKETFFPRNILFNKYFNKHNVCVITPNEIPYNDSSINADFKDGVYSATYGNLAGFQFDTKNVLPQFEHNVLTNNEGNIVLAVRAGTSDYQGVHFIVVQRDALDLKGSFYTPAIDDASTTATLSEYYTLDKPGDAGYPVGTNGENKVTFVNYNNENDSAAWNSRQGKITSAVQNYNSSSNTYIFQKLVEDGTVKFTDEEMKARIENYSSTKRQSAMDDSFQTWSENWKSYAEMLEEQNRQRDYKLPAGHKGSSTDKNAMLSEVCAIGYGTHSGADWQEGGRCYYVK